MKDDVERRIIYFRYCSEANTDKVLYAARMLC